MKTTINNYFVKRVWAEQTGGGCFVSFVELDNGHVLGIDNDSICLYGNEDQFHGGINGNFNVFPMIDRVEFERSLTRYKVDSLAENSLNEMIKNIQDQLGQTDGGFAGNYFMSEKWDFLKKIISDYIQEELVQLDNFGNSKLPKNFINISELNSGSCPTK